MIHSQEIGPPKQLKNSDYEYAKEYPKKDADEKGEVLHDGLVGKLRECRLIGEVKVAEYSVDDEGDGPDEEGMFHPRGGEEGIEGIRDYTGGGGDGHQLLQEGNGVIAEDLPMRGGGSPQSEQLAPSFPRCQEGCQEKSAKDYPG